MEVIEYTYEDYVEGIKEVAKQIQESDFEADYLICIARGGCVPGTYLSHRTRLPVVTVQWNTRDENPFGNESNTWIPEDIRSGIKVIVVDDIVDGGETIKQLLNDWQQSVHDLPLENIRIASMYYNTAQDVNVDYYHRTIDRNEDTRWVIFPWEAV